MTIMDRFSISLSQEELKVVAHAVDASLCVQESLEEAETGDRVKAIDTVRWHTPLGAEQAVCKSISLVDC